MTARVVNLRSFAREGGPRGRIVLPPDVVRIDRGSPWGNPYRIGAIADAILVDDDAGPMDRVTIDRELAILLYRGFAEASIARDPRWLEPLRGRRLACWCAPMLCHGDVLVELETPAIVVEGYAAERPSFGLELRQLRLVGGGPLAPRR